MRDEMYADSAEAVEIHGPDRGGPWLVTCDHASNAVPPWVAGGDLGIAAEDMARHIAWDVGAAGVARHLADALGAPAVLGRFSRLVIDPNRGEDDPTLIMQLYDGTIVPGNRGLTEADRQARRDRLYRPYHRAIETRLGEETVIVSVHSFTTHFKGRPRRPWHIGLLSAGDRRLADPMLAILVQDETIVVGDNEPYTGALRGDAMDRHGLTRGLPHILVEVRNDLIGTAEGQRKWADRLAPVLTEAAHVAGLVANS